MTLWQNLRSIISVLLFDLAAAVAPKQERLSAYLAVYEHFHRLADEEAKRRKPA